MHLRLKVGIHAKPGQKLDTTCTGSVKTVLKEGVKWSFSEGNLRSEIQQDKERGSLEFSTTLLRNVLPRLRGSGPE